MQKLIEHIVRQKLWEQEFKGFEFKDSVTASYDSQVNHTIRMLKDDQLLAYADYVVFESKVYIHYIESKIKGKGYGTILMEYLASLYGYENLERSSLTPSGAKMRARLDKMFGFDYEESQNKLYKPELLAKIRNFNPQIGEFLNFIYQHGQSEGWEKWIEEKGRVWEIDGIDLNDVAEIAQYIRGAKEQLPVTHDPDYWVADTVKKMVAEGIQLSALCPKCDWSWEIDKDDPDPHLCHQCGYDHEEKEFDLAKFIKWKLLHRPVPQNEDQYPDPSRQTSQPSTPLYPHQ